MATYIQKSSVLSNRKEPMSTEFAEAKAGKRSGQILASGILEAELFLLLFQKRKLRKNKVQKSR